MQNIGYSFYLAKVDRSQKDNKLVSNLVVGHFDVSYKPANGLFRSQPSLFDFKSRLYDECGS